MTATITTDTADHGEDFTTSEGLRHLLIRLHQTGSRAWAHDPVAADLMAFAADKYSALARKHDLDAWEAASAAFDVMRKRATREASDPWGVVTHAVRITCIAEERAQGLLCSTHQARRPRYSVFHDAERFSDREEDLSDYHPAFHVHDHLDLDEPEETDASESTPSVTLAVDSAVELVTRLGWPEALARTSIEHICSELARAGSRQAAYEKLRRDQHARALLDLPRPSWMALLKTLLGVPNPAYAATNLGRGILLRLLRTETIEDLLADDDLVLTISVASPTRQASHGR